MKSKYTESITQLNDWLISIEYDVNYIYYISHLSRGDEHRNTQFINGAKKMEALLVFADNVSLLSGRNWTPMLFGSIWDI